MDISWPFLGSSVVAFNGFVVGRGASAICCAPVCGAVVVVVFVAGVSSPVY